MSPDTFEHFGLRITVGALWLCEHPREARSRLLHISLATRPEVKFVSFVDATINLLAAFATKKLELLVQKFGVFDDDILKVLDGHSSLDFETRREAARTLSQILLKIEEEDLLPFSLVQGLMKIAMVQNFDPKSDFAELTALLFSGISMRILLGDRVHLSEFRTLVATGGLAEHDFQKFLTNHPFMIDPLFSQVWPEARLGESLRADFIIKRLDNSLLVVEIERPDTPFFTAYPQFSSEATHAITQAITYRDWVLKNRLYCCQQFGDFGDVEALAVLGRESDLNPEQKHKLQIENETRRGAVRVVGFDWLADRALAITQNAMTVPFGRLGGDSA